MMGSFGNHIMVRITAILLLLCIVISGCTPRGENGVEHSATSLPVKEDAWRDYHVDSLLEYDPSLFSVLLGDGIGANTEAIDALRICPDILYSLVLGDDSDWHEELVEPIDMLMDYYYQYGVLPRAEYEGVGWYCTSMDAPFLALTAEYAYERGLGERFHQYMLDLLPYCVKSTKERGFVLKINEDEWWPLEYAWETVTEDDAWFVINGSLYGMVCVEMLKNLTGDAGLTELSEKALVAYQSKAERFYYPDGVWCYYSLNNFDGKRIINRPEKLFIEIKSLDALYQLTGKEFYLSEQQKRIAMLSDLYPVYLVEDAQERDIYFLRAGAPHPYDIDIFSTQLEIFDSSGKLLLSYEMENDRTPSGAYIKFPVPETATKYRWLAGGYEVTEQPLRIVSKESLDLPNLLGTWSGWADACALKDNNIVTIKADASDQLKAWVQFTFDEPVPYSAETFLIIELENLSRETFSSVTPVIYDTNGNAMDRYSTPCPPGRSYQVLHYTGFKDHDWPIDRIRSLAIGFVTNTMKEEEAQIRLAGVYKTDNTAQLVELLSGEDFSDFWTISEQGGEF